MQSSLEEWFLSVVAQARVDLACVEVCQASGMEPEMPCIQHPASCILCQVQDAGPTPTFQSSCQSKHAASVFLQIRAKRRCNTLALHHARWAVPSVLAGP